MPLLIPTDDPVRKVVFDYICAQYDKPCTTIHSDTQYNVVYIFGPLGDLLQLQSVTDTITTTIIYFSSIDIWTSEPQKEWINQPFEEKYVNEDNPYYKTELALASRYTKLHIVRIGSLFGSMIRDTDSNDNGMVSTYTYCLDDLWKDLNVVIKANLRVVNLAYMPNANNTRHTWLLPHLTDVSYVNAKRAFVARVQAVAGDPLTVVCDTIFYPSEKDQALLLLMNLCPKLEISSLQKYFDFRNGSNWNMYDVQALKKSFENHKVFIYCLSDIFKRTNINLFRSKEAFINHFVRMATFAHVLNAYKLILTDAEARQVADIGNYADVNEAYTSAHADFMQTMRACANHIGTIDNRMMIAIYPTKSSNYLFDNEQVIAMVDVLDHPSIEMSTDIENIDKQTTPTLHNRIPIHTYITMDDRTTVNDTNVDISDSVKCFKIERNEYSSLHDAFQALLLLMSKNQRETG